VVIPVQRPCLHLLQNQDEEPESVKSCSTLATDTCRSKSS
jgi:hypothetical protein